MISLSIDTLERLADSVNTLGEIVNSQGESIDAMRTALNSMSLGHALGRRQSGTGNNYLDRLYTGIARQSTFDF